VSDAWESVTAVGDGLGRLGGAAGAFVGAGAPLRVSLTSRCQLRCWFCHNEGAVPPHAGEGHGQDGTELTAEQMLAAVGTLTGAGFARVQVSGGEPLLSPLARPFLEGLPVHDPDDYTVTLVTNGLLLTRNLPWLAGTHLDRVKVSLHWFSDASLSAIAGGRRGGVEVVKGGIEAAREVFPAVELNVLAQAGNETELDGILAYAFGLGLSAQVIDLVPTTHNGGPAGAGRTGGVVDRLRQVATAEELRLGGTGQSGRVFTVGASRVEVLDGSVPPRRAGQCEACVLREACVEGFWALRLDPSGRVGACLLRDDLRVSVAEHLDRPGALVGVVENYLSDFTEGRLGVAASKAGQRESTDRAGEPDGETRLSTSVAGHDVGVHLILTRGGSVLLGQRVNTGFADGAWHVPGGRLDPGETLPQAAVREAAEELGISVDAQGLQVACVCHHLDPDGQARVGVFFHVTAWMGEPSNTEPNKCTDLRWFALDDLPSPLVDYARTALGHTDAGAVALQGWESTPHPQEAMTT
jgi:GTP 3',8-cyclase